MTTDAHFGINYCPVCHLCYPPGFSHKCIDLLRSEKSYSTRKNHLSNLEIEIRKAALATVEEMMDELHSSEVSITHMKTLTHRIKDRLNLLWGKQ